MHEELEVPAEPLAPGRSGPRNESLFATTIADTANLLDHAIAHLEAGLTD